jgi:hypothetical protein
MNNYIFQTGRNIYYPNPWYDPWYEWPYDQPYYPYTPPRIVYVPVQVPVPVPVLTIPLPQLPPGKTEIKIEITTPKVSLSKKQSKRW